MVTSSWTASLLGFLSGIGPSTKPKTLKIFVVFKSWGSYERTSLPAHSDKDALALHGIEFDAVYSSSDVLDETTLGGLDPMNATLQNLMSLAQKVLEPFDDNSVFAGTIIGGSRNHIRQASIEDVQQVVTFPDCLDHSHVDTEEKVAALSGGLKKARAIIIYIHVPTEVVLHILLTTARFLPPLLCMTSFILS